MEEIYKSLISDPELLAKQFTGAVFGMTEPEGPVLIYVGRRGQIIANHPARAAFLHENPELVRHICAQIDDGQDPCVCKVAGGCVLGTQLASERTDIGHLLIFLQGYTADFVHANMDMFELLMDQAQLICQLLEKNNQLHHSQLAALSKSSPRLNAAYAKSPV